MVGMVSDGGDGERRGRNHARKKERKFIGWEISRERAGESRVVEPLIA